jgi:hypothetical protein
MTSKMRPGQIHHAEAVLETAVRHAGIDQKA